MKDAKLSESYHNLNDPNLEDVTSDFDVWIRDNGDNSANIQFGDIDGAYVISVEGHYDGDSDQELKTRVYETNDTYNGVRRSFTWDNQNILKNTGGNASGDLKI